MGETKRKLCKRLEENKRAVRMADINASAVAEHAWGAGHTVDWSGGHSCGPTSELNYTLPSYATSESSPSHSTETRVPSIMPMTTC